MPNPPLDPYGVSIPLNPGAKTIINSVGARSPMRANLEISGVTVTDVPETETTRVAVSTAALGLPVLIASAALSAVASYTSPTWTNGTYRSIRLELDFTTNGITTSMTLVGPASNSYRSNGLRTFGFATPWTSSTAALLASIVSVSRGIINGDFTVLDNATRAGFFEGQFVDVATGLETNSSSGGWVCVDTTTDVTGFALAFSSNFTGNIRAWGTPL